MNYWSCERRRVPILANTVAMTDRGSVIVRGECEVRQSEGRKRKLLSGETFILVPSDNFQDIKRLRLARY